MFLVIHEIEGYYMKMLEIKNPILKKKKKIHAKLFRNHFNDQKAIDKKYHVC